MSTPNSQNSNSQLLINHWVSRDPPPFRDEILKNYIKKEKHILFIHEAFYFLTEKFIGNVNIFQKFFLEIYTSFTELKFLFFHFKWILHESVYHLIKKSGVEVFQSVKYLRISQNTPYDFFPKSEQCKNFIHWNTHWFPKKEKCNFFMTC